MTENEVWPIQLPAAVYCSSRRDKKTTDVTSAVYMILTDQVQPHLATKRRKRRPSRAARASAFNHEEVWLDVGFLPICPISPMLVTNMRNGVKALHEKPQVPKYISTETIWLSPVCLHKCWNWSRDVSPSEGKDLLMGRCMYHSTLGPWVQFLLPVLCHTT